MTAPAILLKLQPNQDVTFALEAAARAAGIVRGRIVAATGSLTRAALTRPTGIEWVEGPAIEVAALSGDIHADGSSALHAYLCCDDTRVVSGTLARGANCIAITFEVLIEHVSAAPAS